MSAGCNLGQLSFQQPDRELLFYQALTSKNLQLWMISKPSWDLSFLASYSLYKQNHLSQRPSHCFFKIKLWQRRELLSSSLQGNVESQHIKSTCKLSTRLSSPSPHFHPTFPLLQSRAQSISCLLLSIELSSSFLPYKSLSDPFLYI